VGVNEASYCGASRGVLYRPQEEADDQAQIGHRRRAGMAGLAALPLRAQDITFSASAGGTAAPISRSAADRNRIYRRAPGPTMTVARAACGLVATSVASRLGRQAAAIGAGAAQSGFCSGCGLLGL